MGRDTLTIEGRARQSVDRTKLKLMNALQVAQFARQIERETIERCAKVAESRAPKPRLPNTDSITNACVSGYEGAVFDIAAAIRALAEKEDR